MSPTSTWTRAYYCSCHRDPTRGPNGRSSMVRPGSGEGGFRNITPVSLRSAPLLPPPPPPSPTLTPGTISEVLDIPSGRASYTSSCRRMTCHTSSAHTSCAWKAIHRCSTNISRRFGRRRIIATAVATPQVSWRSARGSPCTSMSLKRRQRMNEMAPAIKQRRALGGRRVFHPANAAAVLNSHRPTTGHRVLPIRL